MRRLLVVLLGVVACSEDPAPARVAWPEPLRQALLADRIGDLHAQLVLEQDGAQVSAGPVVPASADGFLLRFEDVEPGVYDFVVRVTGTSGGASVAVLDYRLDNVDLRAGSTSVQGAGRWVQPAAALGDADGDGLSTFAEIVAGLDPGQRWSAAVSSPLSVVVGLTGTDMRALFVASAAGVQGLGNQHVQEIGGSLSSITLRTLPGAAQVASNGSCGAANAAATGVSRTYFVSGFYKALVGTSDGCIGELQASAPNDADDAPVVMMARRSVGHVTWDTGPMVTPHTTSWTDFAVYPDGIGNVSLALRSADRALYFTRHPSEMPPAGYEGWVLTRTEPYMNAPPALILGDQACAAATGDNSLYLGVMVQDSYVGMTPLSAFGGSMGSCSAVIDSALGPARVAIAPEPDRCGFYSIHQPEATGTAALVRTTILDIGTCDGQGAAPQIQTGTHFPLPEGIGAVTAIHYGRATAATQAGGPMLDMLIVGDANGRVYATGPLAALEGAVPPPWIELGQVPTAEPILAIVTDTRDPQGPIGGLPVGVVFPIFVATASNVFRSP